MRRRVRRGVGERVDVRGARAAHGTRRGTRLERSGARRRRRRSASAEARRTAGRGARSELGRKRCALGRAVVALARAAVVGARCPQRARAPARRDAAHRGARRSGARFVTYLRAIAYQPAAAEQPTSRGAARLGAERPTPLSPTRIVVARARRGVSSARPPRRLATRRHRARRPARRAQPQGSRAGTSSSSASRSTSRVASRRRPSRAPEAASRGDGAETSSSSAGAGSRGASATRAASPPRADRSVRVRGLRAFGTRPGRRGGGLRRRVAQAAPRPVRPRVGARPARRARRPEARRRHSARR